MENKKISNTQFNEPLNSDEAQEVHAALDKLDILEGVSSSVSSNLDEQDVFQEHWKDFNLADLSNLPNPKDLKQTSELSLNSVVKLENNKSNDLENFAANSFSGGVELSESEIPIVFLIGAGHLSQEVAKIAYYAGFSITVVDNRPEYILAEKFPKSSQVILLEDYTELLEEHDIDSRHYVVILTHTFESDLEVLRLVLETNARYLGVIGSEQKKERLFNILRDEGVALPELACTCCPIGVTIGAESAQEVAVAIVAELIAARAGCLAKPRRIR